jgi:surface antigen
MTTKKSNLLKGKNSYDSESSGSLIPFINKNITPYPTEVGGPKFDLIPVQKQKDIMINHARMYAQQEYDRIMELVAVLQKQADDIKRRLDVTDAVHSAEYQFQVVMGQCYWLVWDKRKEKMLLTHHGPNDWSSSAPEDYDYKTKVKYMGDHTWMELDEN